MWYVYAGISGLCATLMAILINTRLRGQDALLMTCLFSIVMTTLLILACFVLKKFQGFSLKNFEQRELIALLLTGVCAGVGYLAYFLALKHGPISSVVAIDRLGILYMVVISFMFLNAPFNIWSIVGAVCMVIGAYLITCT